jgi:ABC-2 type transport system ATP-binding protein
MAITALPLAVRGVTKTFNPSFRLPWQKSEKKTVHAVADVTFEIRKGEIYGVIGANGSGKSTLIRMISTLLLPDAGEVSIFGHDVVKESMNARRLINRVSADPSFFRQMSALENLMFFGRVYGLSPREIKVKAPAILERLGLEPKQTRAMVKTLSRGQQQKIAVARAFLTSPILMLLDEPTTGLDPRSKRDVQDFVKEVQRDHEATVLLTTHDMEEAEVLCQRIAFIAGGRIVAEGTPLELRRMVAGGRPVDTISMDDVFMELTGKSIEEDEEEMAANG